MTSVEYDTSTEGAWGNRQIHVTNFAQQQQPTPIEEEEKEKERWEWERELKWSMDELADYLRYSRVRTLIFSFCVCVCVYVREREGNI